MKTGTHEIGHMFSFFHCIYFKCNLNGSNHRMESDAQPLWLCPVCLKKLQWATKFNLSERFAGLIRFCEDNQLQKEADYYRKAQKIVDNYPQ